MNTRTFFRPISLLFLLCALAAPAQAQDENNESPGIWKKFSGAFDGYIENNTAYRIAEPTGFTKVKNSLDLKFNQNFGDVVNLKLDLLGVYDAIYDLDDDLAVEDEEDYRAYVDPREVTLNLSFQKFEMRLGRQIVNWEKTDSLRVLDAVNPLDLQEFIFADLADIRIPLWMGNFEYYFTPDYSLQFLLIPDMTFTELAHTGSEFELARAAVPAGLTLNVADEETPPVQVGNTEYGLRFQGVTGGWDFSLNYLYSWNDQPFKKKTLNASTSTLTVTPAHARVNIVGGSVVNVFFGTVVRFELAAKIGERFSVDDPTVKEMVVDKTDVEYALAFERDFWDMSWLLQAYQKYILDYEEMITPDDEVTTLFTLRVAKDLNQEETLKTEIRAEYRANDGDYHINPKLEYAITDAWKTTFGFDIIGGGDDDSFYGQFDEKDRVYAELRYSF
ncbi:hypothetical protein U14_01904 [Candidatus Moduliflexus flocculans]|uniref:Uncharacterized protein n=1 Tax=Candidatus Moduliflexus flocculans TaxID=1499966 RepID=A0A0S6VXC9_9BACT|nr:hypothetical protein U14_01904 [Candidatus Moduliflexus flocculans]